MNGGTLLLWFTCVAAVAATFLFYRNARGREASPKRNQASPAMHRFAVRCFVAAVAALLLASGLLLTYLLSHDFTYEYVAKYSSSSLPTFYLLSAFWAGQEGTFLLWALLVGVMGLVLLKKSDDGIDDAMAVVSGFIAFLNILMVVKSPFTELEVPPPDGAGLNPLLQNPWMVIHPPILFIGYAAMTFPFALVISALRRKTYTTWLESGYRWVLFASLTLGAGIIIGGFWAYEVLGWGGYWGWDPVENSSLVPWIILLALVHGLIVQRAKGSLLRTNVFLTIMTFLLVLYATFLTRSGVLADFSVHSFVDLGISSYLIAGMIITIMLGFGLFIRRFKEMTAPRIDMSSINREVLLVLGMLTLCGIAFFTIIGTSSPILTGLVGKASQVDTSFYNTVNLPIAILVGLLLGIAPFIGWVEEQRMAFFRRMQWSLVLTAVSLIAAYLLGVTSAVRLFFIAAAAITVWSNLLIGFRHIRVSWMNLGAPLSHIGIGLLLIGILASGSFDTTTQTILKHNTPQDVLGYTMTFTGVSVDAEHKTQVKIEVADGRRSFVASPKLYFSDYNRSMLREPDITITLLKDLYISPLELTSPSRAGTHPVLEIGKGESKDYAGYTVSFVRFETGPHEQTGMMSVGAVLAVTAHGSMYEIIPRMTINERGEREALPAELPALQLPTKGVGRPHVTLDAMNVEDKRVILGFHGLSDEGSAAGSQELVVEVSTKPLMNVVWTGVILILLGFIIAIRRRFVQGT